MDDNTKIMAFFKKVYGWLGFFLLVGMIVAAQCGIPGLRLWVTPAGWWGYILMADAFLFKRKGFSLLRSHPEEFLIMLPVSIVLWCVFELHNLQFQNWEYIGIPQNFWVAMAGYILSFSTILPALVITNLLIQTFLPKKITAAHYHNPGKALLVREIIFGLILIIFVCLFPSTYTGPLIWAGYLFVFAPLNYLLGFPGFLKSREGGDFTGTVSLCLTGVVTGLLWEFLNYWAGTKWVYHVPYFENIKIFEMPALGFLGFIPFAVLFIEMYNFLRYLPSLILKRGHDI